MGLIIPQKVKIKWTGNTRKHYESKGYIYTKNEYMSDNSFISL